MGVVVFALELPTSGFADAFGRRPVFVAAAVVNVDRLRASYLVADSFWAFAVARRAAGGLPGAGLRAAGGVVRRHRPRHRARRRRRPVPGGAGHRARRLDRGRRRCISGGLVCWDPLPAESALLLPLLVLRRAQRGPPGGGRWLLLKEPRTHVDATGVRRAPPRPARRRSSSATASAAAHNRVLRGIVLVEVFWGTAMVVFETFQPIRLAELARQRGAGRRPDGSGRGGRLGRLRPRRRRWPGSTRPGSGSPGPRSWPGSSTASARW